MRISFLPYRLWRKNNPNYTTERKKHDPTFKLIKNVRRRLKRFLDINYTNYELDKAYTISLEGRPGPVWLDFPIDVQGSFALAKNLKVFRPKIINKNKKININSIQNIISKSKRPIFWFGHGIRLSAKKDF